MEFTIPYPKTKSGMKEFCRQYGLNAIYSGKFWRRRKENSEYWHEIVKLQLMQQRISRRMFQSPVCITFYWNDNMDCSNHAYIAKMIEDALKGYLLQDDSRQYVKEIRHKFYDKPFITVELEELK
jgi:hypothetical protein